MILTGQRRDEVAKMARRELREGGTLWTIPAARTKNGTAQDVPLAKIAREVIVRQPRISARAGSEYIFTVGGDKPICGYSSIKADIDAAVAAIALEEAAEDEREPVQVEPWRFHDLRRTVASGMARMGIALHVIEAVLNHRSGQISGVAAVYNRHSYLPEKRRALEAWADHIQGLVAAQPNAVLSLRGAA